MKHARTGRMFHVKRLPRRQVRGRCFHVRSPWPRRTPSLLTDEATVRGLIGPREVPRLWERHLLNCAVVADLMPEDSSVCDIGQRRRTARHRARDPSPGSSSDFVGAIAASHHVSGPRCVHNGSGQRDRPSGAGRGPARRVDRAAGWFDVVTSRAVAPMDRLARWSLPLVRSGGLFLAMKGSSAADELDAVAAGASGRLGGARRPRWSRSGSRWLAPPVTRGQRAAR